MAKSKPKPKRLKLEEYPLYYEILNDKGATEYYEPNDKKLSERSTGTSNKKAR